MNQENSLWKEEYDVGIDIIDEAHKKLFREARSIEARLETQDYNRYACIETIKFLREYMENHFAAEEGAMRSRGYAGYKLHKELHDNMRENVVPGLIEKLRASDFSRDAIDEFATVLLGWLAGHVMIEDKAITGRAVSRFTKREKDNRTSENIIDEAIRAFMKDLMGLDVELRDYMYDGFAFPDAFLYEVDFSENYRVSFTVQYGVIKSVVGLVLGRKIEELDRNAIMAHVQIGLAVTKAVLNAIFPLKEFKMIDHRAVAAADFEARLKTQKPLYNLLWSSEKGLMSICVETY